MADAVGIFFQGLLFFIVLHIIGHPITRIFLRRQGIPSKLANLDFVERLPLEFVVGGTVLYIIALITTPFKVFNALVSWLVTGIAAAFYLYQHRKVIASFSKQSSLRSLINLARKQSLYSWAALACFILALAIRVGPISNFVLGSNQDISLHTLYTYSVVRNGGIPDSAIPGYALQTPVATHTILAYFSMLTGLAPEFVTFYSLVFFGAGIVLAAFLFGSIIGSKEFGLYTALLMVNISVYPIGITWGSPWLVLGLLAFFVIASVSIVTCVENFRFSKAWIYIALFPGILMGFLACTYLPLYIILLIMLLLLIVFGRKEIPRKIGGLAVMVASGIPLVAIWIYRYLVIQPYSPYFAERAAEAVYAQALQASTTFLPLRDLYRPPVVINTFSNWLTWSDKLGWPGAYIFVPLLGAGCFLFFYYLIRRRTRFFEDFIPKYILAILVIIFLWGLNGPLGLFYIRGFGLDIMMGELDKIAPIIGTILLPVVIAYALKSFGDLLKKYWKAIVYTSYHVVFFLFSISIAIVPLSQAWLVGNYYVYATCSEYDYALLKWMNAEIPYDSDVMVNPFDAGQYVPSIGGQKAFGIASTGVVFLDEQYAALHYHLYNTKLDPCKQALDSNTVGIFHNVNVDYIFVGGCAFNPQENWEVQYFINNPMYFRVVKNISDSYLFSVKIPSRSMNIGFVNNSDYIGFSNNETLIDFKGMTMYNLETGEGVNLEIALKDYSNNDLDTINPWNEPRDIEVSQIENQSISFRLVGSAYSFNLALSSNEMKEISLSLSVDRAPKSSVIYFSYFPVYHIRQPPEHQFTIDKVGPDWGPLSNSTMVQTSRAHGATSFYLIPKNHQIWGYTDPKGAGYVVIRSNTLVNIALKTSPINEQG